MLEIINSLSIFFEDCYREISVREYSREMKISPPTASKILKNFEEQGLLLKREERGFLLFRANRENNILKNLSLIYWEEKLSSLIDFLGEEFYPNSIVLFGSLSKLEARKESDVDILVLTNIKKDIDLTKFENKLKRKLQLFIYDSLDKINKELRLNIINAHKIKGYLK